MALRPLSVIVDTREQHPFRFSGYPVEIVTGSLFTGDYSLPGYEQEIAIERKSLDDLVGCLKNNGRERFERELARGRYMRFFAVVVEAGYADIRRGTYRSEMRSEAALQSLAAFSVRYRVGFQFCGNRKEAEYWTYSLLAKFAAEQRIRYERLISGQAVAI